MELLIAAVTAIARSLSGHRQSHTCLSPHPSHSLTITPSTSHQPGFSLDEKNGCLQEHVEHLALARGSHGEHTWLFSCLWERTTPPPP